MNPRYPALYQLNTRVRLNELGSKATLDDLPDADLEALAKAGYDWVWLLSVWTTGEAGRQVSRANRDWRREFEETLPDLREEDIAGSGFAIAGYTVSPALGGDAALARLRERMRKRGLKLMLDFVPNHLALDHPWAELHPDYFVPGKEHKAFAYGRDPYFPGWPDTLQVDYSNPAAQGAMLGELSKIAGQCDGVRCDMAMLVLPAVFERTWGRRPAPFWPRATATVRELHPGFVFMAEVYWDLEWTMLQQGFDYAYDKRLYDRLRDGHARAVREHLYAGLDFQDHLARFLENHDEPRAASAFAPGQYQAAAVITYLSPGLRFVHQGQREGRQKRISPHLVRGPKEPVDPAKQAFHDALLAVAGEDVVRNGAWRLLERARAWDGNPTFDDFITWSWEHGTKRLLVAVNYSGHQSQCYVKLPGGKVRLEDRLGPARYDREGDSLYLDLPPWGFHVFDVALDPSPRAAEL